MSEIEVTWSRVLRIWWLLTWRTLFGAFAFLGVSIGLLGFAGYFLGFSQAAYERTAVWIVYCMFLFGPFIMLPVIRMAFKKKFNDFRIQLISPAL
jgi:hypothetical protein